MAGITTQQFKTKTIFQPRSNPSVPGFWGVSIDVGYSSVKIFSPNMIASFPSYAQKLTNEQQSFQLGDAAKSDILYKGEDGQVWAVGEKAQNMIDDDSASSNTAAMYVRDRTYSEMFLVIARCGIALGMQPNSYGTPKGTLHVQTGLPPAYMRKNSMPLKEALTGKHEFSIKVGANPWQKYSFTLPMENIAIMPQPLGTLVSIATDRNGGATQNAKDLMSSNLLVVDPGFGTLDTFSIKSMTIDSQQTFDNLGMKRVLEETSDEIRRRYGEDIPVSAMQKHLASGTFTKFDRRTRQSDAIDFADILEECSNKVCDEALRVLDDTYNGLSEHKYLVITGGTGAAWDSRIRRYYSGMHTLTVLSGDMNDTIPAIFSNVRGYYMQQLNFLKKMRAKA